MKRNDLLKTICLIVLIVGLTVGSALALNLVTGPRIEAEKILIAERRDICRLPAHRGPQRPSRGNYHRH